MLDWVPAELRVMRVRRPKYGCRSCCTIHQTPAPERLVAKGLATPGLIAHVLGAGNLEKPGTFEITAEIPE